MNALPGPSAIVLTDYEKKEEPMPVTGAKGVAGTKPGQKPSQVVRGGAKVAVASK